MSDHRARYKNSALDAKELRRRREEDSFQLRRQKRDDVLSKRRTLAPINVKDDLEVDGGDQFNETSESIQDLNISKEIIDGLLQDENQQLLVDNAQRIRKLLSKEPQPPFDQVIQSGLIPRFIALLDRDDNPTLQFEVAWILTNVCSGTTDQTLSVVDNGAVPRLMRLLKSTDIRVCEQAVWALGNIIGEGADLRDLVIEQGFVPALLSHIRPEQEIGFLRNQTWVIVNLCRNKDPPPKEQVICQLIPALIYLVQSTDLAILIDTTWAISYITELGSTYSQLIIDSKLVEKITPLLSHKETKIQTAAIRALGSIVTGDEDQTQAVIDAGALPHLNRILNENKDRIIKEALWFISNITAGSTNQIQAVIDNQIIPSIVHYLDKGDFSQQKEAAWTVYNMSLSGTPKQLYVLFDSGVISPLCNMLSLTDNGVIRNLLEALSTLLGALHEDYPAVLSEVEECGGLDKIESLQNYPNQDIYQFAYTIIDKYFTE